MPKTCIKCSALFVGRRCLECKKISDKKWYEANKDKCIAAVALWAKNNPDKANANKRRWVERHPDKKKQAAANWYYKNPEKIKAYGHNYRTKKSGRLTPGLDKKLYKLQSGLCACCKKPLGNNYHMDHIMPISLGGANEDWNMQLLTQRCNQQKSAKHPIDFMQSRGFLL